MVETADRTDETADEPRVPKSASSTPSIVYKFFKFMRNLTLFHDDYFLNEANKIED